MNTDERIKKIKEEFFRYRNGIVADTLRKAGYPHKVIFGLGLPQIAGIARPIGQDTGLAEVLWNDKDVRESRILSTYLFCAEDIPEERVLSLCGQTRTQEEADMLAFRLLKHMRNPDAILGRLKESDTESAARCAKALEAHLDKS